MNSLRIAVRSWSAGADHWRRSVRAFWCIACGCGALGWVGCLGPREAAPSGAASLTVEDILDRCVGACEGIQTLQVRGLFRDYRRETRRATTISWDFAPPDRCRLQINMDVALITEDGWQKYEAATGRYRSYRHFTRTPFQTSAYLLSNRVPFLLPAVIMTGERAFGKSRVRGYADWMLEGVQWLAEHPCYMLRRPAWGRETSQVLRVWVDQDLFLIRGWALIAPEQNGRERTILGCTYYDLLVNEPLPPDCFDAKPPKPILLSQPDDVGRGAALQRAVDRDATAHPTRRSGGVMNGAQ